MDQWVNTLRRICADSIEKFQQCAKDNLSKALNIDNTQTRYSVDSFEDEESATV